MCLGQTRALHYTANVTSTQIHVHACASGCPCVCTAMAPPVCPSRTSPHTRWQQQGEGWHKGPRHRRGDRAGRLGCGAPSSGCQHPSPKPERLPLRPRVASRERPSTAWTGSRSPSPHNRHVGDGTEAFSAMGGPFNTGRRAGSRLRGGPRAGLCEEGAGSQAPGGFG